MTVYIVFACAQYYPGMDNIEAIYTTEEEAELEAERLRLLKSNKGTEYEGLVHDWVDVYQHEVKEADEDTDETNN